MDSSKVFEVQRLYPQIYLSCHLDHVRASSTKWKLSSRDAAILAHLDVENASSPRSLANHIGVVPSTLSAALKRLSRLGYIRSVASEDDKRRRQVFLTDKGAEAMAGTSVLDRDKVARMLGRLSKDELETALLGLGMLARAARDCEVK